MLHADAPVPHTDGSPRFTSDRDAARQAATAALIERAWRVTLVPVGGLSFIDYLAVRHDRPVAWVEVIQRVYTSGQLAQMGGVWLKLATCRTLRRLAEVPLSVDWHGGFVVWHLADGLHYADVTEIPARPCEGFDPRGAPNDRGEAMVRVPVLRPLRAPRDQERA